jgi:hypothetical protein
MRLVGWLFFINPTDSHGLLMEKGIFHLYLVWQTWFWSFDVSSCLLLISLCFIFFISPCLDQIFIWIPLGVDLPFPSAHKHVCLSMKTRWHRQSSLKCIRSSFACLPLHHTTRSLEFFPHALENLFYWELLGILILARKNSASGFCRMPWDCPFSELNNVIKVFQIPITFMKTLTLQMAEIQLKGAPSEMQEAWEGGSAFRPSWMEVQITPSRLSVSVQFHSLSSALFCYVTNVTQVDTRSSSLPQACVLHTALHAA